MRQIRKVLVARVCTELLQNVVMLQCEFKLSQLQNQL